MGCRLLYASKLKRMCFFMRRYASLNSYYYDYRFKVNLAWRAYWSGLSWHAHFWSHNFVDFKSGYLQDLKLYTHIGKRNGN